jgi:hypothetical protein
LASAKAEKQREYPSLLSKRKERQKEAENYAIKLQKVRSDLLSKETEATDLENKIRYWESPSIYFEEPWSQIVSTTTSDADGKFTLEVPKNGKFIIAAKSSRLVNNSKEEYGWLLAIESEKQSEVLLNNNNLLP